MFKKKIKGYYLKGDLGDYIMVTYYNEVWKLSDSKEYSWSPSKLTRGIKVLKHSECSTVEPSI